MLPKHNRLTRLEVTSIKRTRTTPISGQFFGLVKLTKAGESKFAVLVSAKLSKSAVVRNRIRRTVYDAIYPLLNHQIGWYLFLANKKSIEASREDVEKDVRYLISINSK